MYDTANNKISNLIESQVPSFVRNDHPAFMDFLEAYYEYLEQNNKAVARANELLSYRDVDQTVSEFSERLYNEFLSAIPKDALVDKDLVIKHVKDFYRAKGSEKALKFLLRIMFGKEAKIYYPKKDVLRLSDGKWYIQKSLRVETTSINGTSNNQLTGLELFISRRITGNTSNASATVERVDRFYEIGTLVDELVLSSVQGTFVNGEMVYTSYTDDSGNTVRANTYVNSGRIQKLTINERGLGYAVNNPLVFESDTGSGAAAIVSEVSQGNIGSINIVESGAGFLANDWISIIDGVGSGANARVLTVNTTGQYHNTHFTIYTTTVADIANLRVSDTPYTNLRTDIVPSPDMNSTLADTLNQFVYGPTGPVESIQVISGGQNYITQPSISIASNNTIKSFGILGKLSIVSAGVNYTVGDIIEIIGGTGTGGMANVKEISSNGSIVSTEFLEVSGLPKGGVGYSMSSLPTTNVSTSTGWGANIVVSAILGAGERLSANLSNAGEILAVTLTNPGSGYRTAPTVNTRAYGSVSANITSEVIQGVYSYPGRYLNDDGHMSSTNYLQDRDYYQSFSYVVIVEESLAAYKTILLNLVHPAGAKLFGVYEKEISV